MKNKLLFTMLFMITISFMSCRVGFNHNRLDGDIERVHQSGDTLYYDGKPIAYYSNMELECLKNKCVVEISINQFNRGFSDTTTTIMKYVKSKHKNSKIEVKVN